MEVVLQKHGKVDVSGIAADAFGNALGNSIVGALRTTDAEQKSREAQMRVEMAQEEATRGGDSPAVTGAGTNGSRSPVSVSAEEYDALAQQFGSRSYGVAALERLGINVAPGAGGGIQTFAYHDLAADLGRPVPIPAATTAPPDHLQAINWLGQQRASDQAYYTNAINNAQSGLGAAFNAIGRSLNDAAYDIAQGGVGLYGLATDGDLRSRTLDAVGNAVSNFAAHPLDSAAAGYGAAVNYFGTTSTQQIGEDALRFVAGGLATDGLGRVVSSGGDVALSGLRGIGETLADGGLLGPSAGSLAAQRGALSLGSIEGVAAGAGLRTSTVISPDRV